MCVCGKSENVQTKQTSTHIGAQSFNILPTLSDHRSGILQRRSNQHWGTRGETILRSDGKLRDLLCSVAEFWAPPCRQSFVIAYGACPPRYPQQNASLKWHSQHVHLSHKSCNEPELATDLFFCIVTYIRAVFANPVPGGTSTQHILDVLSYLTHIFLVSTIELMAWIRCVW